MATSRELAEQAFSLLQDALKDSEARAQELDSELRKKRAPRNQIEQQIKVLEHRLETLRSESDKWQREATQLQEILENERARARQLKKKLEVSESGPDKVGKKEVNYWRQRAEEFDADTEQYKQRIIELNKELETVRNSIAAADNKADDQLRQRDARLVEQSAQIAALEAEAVERERRMTELAEAGQQAEARQQELQQKLSALENELREETECTINLSEIANERKEQITELTEKLDEALERYAEAKWQLERAGRFERLVARRRKLIDSLIEGLRAKQKSNTALKAGIDGLRKFKAKSEEQQQKLLVRVEELSTALRELRERLATERKSNKSKTIIAGLEDKLNSQARTIDQLESELGAARTARQSAENQTQELTEVRYALEQRDSAVAALEAESAELRRQLEQLSDGAPDAGQAGPSDEQQKLLIEDLQLEIDTLKGELQRQQEFAADARSADPEAATAIRRRESQLGDLKRKIKDRDREIARLKEVASGWQKKYEFLSADAPSAYQSANEK